jgi:mono/diheme cytochrome c family protein
MNKYRICSLGAVLLLVFSVTAAAADLSAAKGNYKILCANCHGASGAGDGSAGSSLPAKPTDFTNCSEMAKTPDTRLSDAIKNGGASVGLSSAMPSQGVALTDGDIKDMVVYIRSFCRH